MRQSTYLISKVEMVVELILTVGVMDYPRIPITEMHLGKFPDSMEFQSPNPHITMHWIKEVEIAKLDPLDFPFGTLANACKPLAEGAPQVRRSSTTSTSGSPGCQ